VAREHKSKAEVEEMLLDLVKETHPDIRQVLLTRNRKDHQWSIKFVRSGSIAGTAEQDARRHLEKLEQDFEIST
jgi:hypothetical protein